MSSPRLPHAVLLLQVQDRGATGPIVVEMCTAPVPGPRRAEAGRARSRAARLTEVVRKPNGERQLVTDFDKEPSRRPPVGPPNKRVPMNE